MASAAIHDACVAFFEADVRAGVNAEQSSLLTAGSVTTARGPLSAASSRRTSHPVSVEVVPRGERPARVVGIGWEEVDLVYDLRLLVRRKGLPEGKLQLDVVEDMARALERRYRGVTNLAIAPAGATFRRSRAELVEIDEDPDQGELTTGVVRVVLTFTESAAANA